MDKKRLIFPVILIILLAVGEIFKTNPEFIEKAYTRGLYPVIIRTLNQWSGLVPFSLFEALLSFLLLALVGACCLLVWQLPGKSRRRGTWANAGVLALSMVLGFLVLFQILWGFNYYRVPLAQQLGIQVQKHSAEELAELCKSLIQEANTLSAAVDRDNRGVMIQRGSFRDVSDRSAQGFLKAHEKLPLFEGRFRSPKPIWNSVIMSYVGTAGMYSPFTGEANVNTLLPAALLPATAMHEMAHVHGYAREDEANFIAWLTCKYHPDSDFRYSGALFGLIYGMNALYHEDLGEYKRLKAEYSAGVTADLTANRDFWKQYDGPAEQIHEQVNDRYLKANGQADGVDSYGRMVDLLLEVKSGSLKID